MGLALADEEMVAHQLLRDEPDLRPTTKSTDEDDRIAEHTVIVRLRLASLSIETW